MKRTILRIGIFLALLVLVLGYANSVFKFKFIDGINEVSSFYEQKDNTVDVLILGSSHSFENFNTGTLWDEYGMSSYVLAGSIQPFWNTYYYLREALKTQTPRLIVLDAYMAIFTEEYVNDSAKIKNNYGLHWSKDKIDSLKISVPKEEWKDFFPEYNQYHSRYYALSKEDFFYHQGDPLYDDWKGFVCNMDTIPYENVDMSYVTEREELYEKTEEYFRKIINLAKEKNIPVIVVVAPYAGINESDQRVMNRVGDIANELSVPFFDCNQVASEIGLDYSVDAADISHLNYRGNQKFSKYMGGVFKEYYDIPDHRGDENYESWDRQAEFIRQMIYDQELKELGDTDLLCAKTQNPNYWVFATIDGNVDAFDVKFQNCLEKIGITDVDSRLWVLDGGNVIWRQSGKENEMYRRTLPHDFYIGRKQNDDGTYFNSVVIDKVSYGVVKNGINLVVYDSLTEKVVDSFGIDADYEYSVLRSEN